MSGQHISGNMTTSASQELGPFITIGDQVRVRKGSVTSYRILTSEMAKIVCPQLDGHICLAIYLGGAPSIYPVLFQSEEEANNELRRLDWIFDKIYKDWNE